MGSVRYFRTFRMLTYLGCSRQSQRRTWRTHQRQTSASTAKLLAGRIKLKLIANDERLNWWQTYRGDTLSTAEYVHFYYVSSSSSSSHLDKCANQFLHPTLVHRFEKSRLKSWLVELQLPHLVMVIMSILILVKMMMTMLMMIVL